MPRKIVSEERREHEYRMRHNYNYARKHNERYDIDETPKYSNTFNEVDSAPNTNNSERPIGAAWQPED